MKYIQSQANMQKLQKEEFVYQYGQTENNSHIASKTIDREDPYGA